MPVNRFIWKILSALLMIALLAGCAPTTTQPVTSISVSGAFALYPLMVQWTADYQKENPDVRIDVSAGGAGKGMSDVLSNAVDIAMLSRPVADEEKDKGALAIPVARDAVFGVLNAKNPYKDQIMKQGISKDMLQKIFMSGQTVTWGEVIGKPEVTDEVHVFTRSDSAGAAEMWAKYMGGAKQEELQGIGVNGDPGILDAVLKDPLGIGYNNLGYAFDLKTGQPVNGIFILPMDANGNAAIDTEEVLSTRQQAVDAIGQGKYPSPPARDLYLVTKGKPSGAAAKFLNWILDAGQQDLSPAGYVALPASDLAAAQDLIK